MAHCSAGGITVSIVSIDYTIPRAEYIINITMGFKGKQKEQRGPETWEYCG